MTQTFPCPACGAPNEPEAGTNRMACAYCGANLTIPEKLRTEKFSRPEKVTPQVEAIPRPQIEAADFIRKAQPVAVGAWNLFAAWTWLRWLFPACLTIFILGCVALGVIPLVWGLTR
jgi:DNA-directed RNA polymerase subunit RPC12/RpoP